MSGAFFATLLGWVCGAAIQLQQAELWPMWGYGAMAVVAMVLGLSCAAGLEGNRRAWGGTVVVAALILGCLGFAQTGARAVWFAQTQWPNALNGADFYVTGVVAELPQIGQSRQSQQRFVFDVERYERIAQRRTKAAQSSQETESLIRTLPRRIQLSWYPNRQVVAGGNDSDVSDFPAVKPGERWRLPVRLRAPHGNLNPHAFDYELWQWSRGVQAVGYVGVAAALPQSVSLGQTANAPVERLRQWTRERLMAQLDGEAADKEQAQRFGAILAALVMGDQAAISASDWVTFRDTGVAHLVAVSGMHITLFAWLAIWGIRLVWRRLPGLARGVSAPVAAWVGGVALAAAYAAFCGWGVPAQRTIAMLAIAAALRLCGTHWPRPVIWLAAMAAIVAMDPWALMEAGFWLSFVAVGVLIGAEAGMGREPSAWNQWERGDVPAKNFGSVPQQEPQPELKRGGNWKHQLRHQLVAMLREQCMLAVALTPLTWLLFHQVSLVGLLVNLVAIPVVTFVILPLALLGLALPVLWSVDAWLLQWVMNALEWCASIPAAIWGMAARPLPLAIAAALAAIALVFPGPWRWKLQLIPTLLPFALWHWDAPKKGEFSVVGLDVGQGQSVLVQTAKHALLVDAGPQYRGRDGERVDAGERVIVPYLRARGVVLDSVLLSHSDVDHTGGAEAVLTAYPEAQWLGSIPWEHALHSLRRGGPCVAGMRWTWDGVEFRVLHPESAKQYRSTNAQSCVLHVSNGERAVLLPGDIGTEQERELLARWPEDVPMQASVVFMPHHGSKSSSSVAWVNAISPTWAVAQAGFGNRFGHPHPGIVARYKAQRAGVFDSASCGAWMWSSDNADHPSCWRQDARRYWHWRGLPE